MSFSSEAALEMILRIRILLGQRKVIFVIKLRNKEIKNLFTNRYCGLIIQFERGPNYFSRF